MSDRTWTIIGAVFGILGFGDGLYSTIVNKGIVFNARTLLFVSLIVIGLVLVIVFGTRNKRKKEKVFTNRIFNVKVDYDDNDYVHLTITNITRHPIQSIRVIIPKNRNSHSGLPYPYLTDKTSFLLNPYESRHKEIDINKYRKRFDVEIKWGDEEGTFLLKQI